MLRHELSWVRASGAEDPEGRSVGACEGRSDGQGCGLWAVALAVGSGW